MSIPIELQDLQKRFTYHPPLKTQIQEYELIRGYAHDLAIYLVKHTPTSREQSLALTHLEEVVMWANAAIARH